VFDELPDPLTELFSPLFSSWDAVICWQHKQIVIAPFKSGIELGVVLPPDAIDTFAFCFAVTRKRERRREKREEEEKRG
jgi:hypothetical protein